MEGGCVQDRIEVADRNSSGRFNNIGNGKHGALVFGDLVNEKIIINHARLYMPVHESLMLVNTGAHLKEIRQMIAEELSWNGKDISLKLVSSSAQKVLIRTQSAIETIKSDKNVNIFTENEKYYLLLPEKKVVSIDIALK